MIESKCAATLYDDEYIAIFGNYYRVEGTSQVIYGATTIKIEEIDSLIEKLQDLKYLLGK